MKNTTFEKGIEELEKIIMKLENEKTPLEDAVALFTQGNEIKKHCQKILDDIKYKVEKVTKERDITELDN